MMYLIMIAVGAIFAFLMAKKTWYPAWAFLFNVLVAIFIGVMLGPMIAEAAGLRAFLGGFAFGVCILAISGIIFAIAQLLTFKFVTSVFCVSMPRLVDNIGAKVLNFIAGYIIAGFLIFTLFITPLAGRKEIRKFSADKSLAKTANASVLKSCKVINAASLQHCKFQPEKRMSYILSNWHVGEDSNDTYLDNEPNQPTE